MGKPEKLLRKWRGNRPVEVRVQDVKTILNAFFPSEWDWTSGSHIVVRSEILKKFPDYQPFGELTIPVKKGQKVKGFYIKELITAINIIQEYKET